MPSATKLKNNVANRPRFLDISARRWDTREKAVIGKQYFVRQATILFGIAKAAKNPKMSAALMDKAADLKMKVDELGARRLPKPCSGRR